MKTLIENVETIPHQKVISTQVHALKYTTYIIIYSVIQPWGHDPTWGHLKFKWGRPEICDTNILLIKIVLNYFFFYFQKIFSVFFHFHEYKSGEETNKHDQIIIFEKKVFDITRNLCCQNRVTSQKRLGS